MSDRPPPPVGSIAWRDLTVRDAAAVRDFYAQVVGWTAKDHPMPAADGHAEYADFEMQEPGSGTTVAGICHARGANASIPPQWIVYVHVADVEASARRCAALGGNVVDGPRPMGGTPFCVVQDPAGAVLGLIQPPAPTDG